MERAIRSKSNGVTPLAGVWVEIPVHQWNPERYRVTPLAGVWVEISTLPLSNGSVTVTPLAGVWVEISGEIEKVLAEVGHSPCGSVG